MRFREVAEEVEGEGRSEDTDRAGGDHVGGGDVVEVVEEDEDGGLD